MSELKKVLVNRDLITLEEMIDDGSLPQRDWGSIISVYNQNNNPFPISPLTCAKLIQGIKEGLKPASVFKEYSLSYKEFTTRYNKDLITLEELCSKNDISEIEYKAIISLRNDPHFILGRDLERVRAYRFNELQRDLRNISKIKAETFLTYLKEFHPEEFENKQENKGVEVTINFGPGILESI